MPSPQFILGLLALCATSIMAAGRIDTHFHALPPQYIDALNKNGGDPSGFKTPDWSLDAAIKSMDAVGTSLGTLTSSPYCRLYSNSSGIMSVSSPGVPITGTGDTARKLARTLNTQLANYTTSSKCKKRLGFFGTLPDFQDVNGTVAEIDFLFKQQKLCAGVTIYSSYGGKLLGHPDFKPIWARLQTYKALVFLHPSVLDVTPFFIGPSIPQPIVDYPLATTRAAVDLVMTGTVRACPDVDIILSHAGGTIPFIATRAINSLAIPDMWSHANVNIVQATEDFARFYYDIALSTSNAQLDGLLDFTDSSHILFGSDFPYAPQFGIDAIVQAYEGYVAKNARGKEIAPEKLRANSLKLLNKHSLGTVYS